MKSIIFDTSNAFVKVSCHDDAVMYHTPSKSASRLARSSVDEGPLSQHDVRPHITNKLHCEEQTSHDPRQPVLSTECADYTPRPRHTVKKQHCLGRRQNVAPQLDAQFTQCRSSSIAAQSGERFGCSPRRCLPLRDRHLALSPVSAKLLVISGVFVFRSLLMNRYQRLQVLSLSFRCPHSLCRTVGGQDTPRKPRPRAGRPSTPETKTDFDDCATKTDSIELYIKYLGLSHICPSWSNKAPPLPRY